MCFFNKYSNKLNIFIGVCFWCTVTIKKKTNLDVWWLILIDCFTKKCTWVHLHSSQCNFFYSDGLPFGWKCKLISVRKKCNNWFSTFLWIKQPNRRPWQWSFLGLSWIFLDWKVNSKFILSSKAIKRETSHRFIHQRLFPTHSIVKKILLLKIFVYVCELSIIKFLLGFESDNDLLICYLFIAYCNKYSSCRLLRCIISVWNYVSVGMRLKYTYTYVRIFMLFASSVQCTHTVIYTFTKQFMT